MTTTETYGPVSLPTLFLDDHFLRVEVTALADITIHRDGPKTVTLTFNNLASLAEFVSDADYYTDEGIAQDMRESGCGNLVSSAKRCLDKFAKAGLLDIARSKEGRAALNDEYEKDMQRKRAAAV